MARQRAGARQPGEREFGGPAVGERAQSPYLGGESWACIDAPDFPILRDGRWLEPDNQAFPGTWEQVGLLVSDRLGDGPVPEHYEPLESPLNNRLNGAYASPVLLAAAAKAPGAAGDDGAVDAAVADALARTTPLCRRIARPIPLRRSSTARTAATALGAP